MKSNGTAAIALFGSLLAWTPAQAATVHYDQVVTLDKSMFGDKSFQLDLTGNAFTLSPGDSIVGSISFAKNGRIFASDSGFGSNESLLVVFTTDNGNVSSSTATLSLTGLEGSYNAAPVTGTTGQAVGAFRFGDLTSSSFSFTGLNFQINYGSGSATSFKPTVVAINHLGLSFTYDGAPVPEPSSWASLIAGFGMLGATARSRRQLRLVQAS